MFTRCALLRHTLHRRTSPGQSAQRGSSQRRHSPLISVVDLHLVQLTRPGDTNEQAPQSKPQDRHVLAGVRTVSGKLCTGSVGGEGQPGVGQSLDFPDVIYGHGHATSLTQRLWRIKADPLRTAWLPAHHLVHTLPDVQRAQPSAQEKHSFRGVI